MNRRFAAFSFFAAFSLLLTGSAQATGTGPAVAQGVRPTPTRRAPVARPAAAPAPEAAAAPKPEAAPRTVSVSGTIVGTDGQPRPGVSVFPTTNPRLIAVTDATGTFHLQVPAAEGFLRLQADYFGVGSSRVEVDGQHPQPVRIVLGQ